MKTAVEWLVEQITDGTIPAREAIQQAKEMEKEQIFDSFNAGYINSLERKYKTTEQYYDKTFKSEIKWRNIH